MSIHEEIARRLKQEREHRRLSQQELARQLGVAANTVSRWETGTYRPRLDDLEKVAMTLGIAVGDLIPQNSRVGSVDLDRLINIAKSLPPEDLAEVQRFAEFRRTRTEK